MMVSLGMGTSVLSSAMSPAMSQYPPWERTDRYQSDNSCRSVDIRRAASARRSRQKSRLLPAAAEPVSEKGPQAAFSHGLVERLQVQCHLRVGPRRPPLGP